MPIKLLFLKDDEQYVVLKKSQKVLILENNYKAIYIPTYEPYKNAELIKGTDARQFFMDWIKEKFGQTSVTSLQRWDNWYWLYPEKQLNEFVQNWLMIGKPAAFYDHPKVQLPDGSMYFEAEDCDNRGFEWCRAIIHWAFAGQLIYSFAGASQGGFTHAYTYLLSKERTMIPLNGSVEQHKVKSVYDLFF